MHWRQSGSPHTWRHQSPCRPSTWATFTLSSHWGRPLPAKKKKSFASRRAGSLQLCRTLRDPVDCSLPGFSIREGGSLGKNPGAYLANTGCHTLLETIFPAALAANSPEYLLLPEPLWPKQLHHLHTWPSQGQTQVLQRSLRSKPQWMTQM